MLKVKGIDNKTYNKTYNKFFKKQNETEFKEY